MELYSLPSVTIPPYSVAILNVLRHKSGTGKRKNPGKSTIPRVTEMAECPRKDSNEIEFDQVKHGTNWHSEAVCTASCTAEIEISAAKAELLSLWHAADEDTRRQVIELLRSVELMR